MSPLALILFVAIAGLLLWLLQKVPMDATIAQILRWVIIAIVVIVVVVWFMGLFGVSFESLNQPMRLR